MWVAAGLAGLVSVAPGIDRAVSDESAAQEAVDGFAIDRAPDGQFYVDGQIGGMTVRFLVDQDADAVLIAGRDAERIGLAPAGGRVRLPSLAIGPARQQSVTAQVASTMPVSVLGRSYLDRIAGTEVRGDRLILR